MARLKIIFRIFAFVVISASLGTGVGLASTWHPVGTDDFAVQFTSTSSAGFVIFDDNVATSDYGCAGGGYLVGDNLPLSRTGGKMGGATSDTIYFHQQDSGEWYLTRNSTDDGSYLLILTDSPDFQLGFAPDSNSECICLHPSYRVDNAGFSANGSDSYTVNWDYSGSCYNGSGSLTMSPVAPVPIPGAFWLLGFGLVGLTAVRKRKS